MGSADTTTVGKKLISDNNDTVEEYGPNLKILPSNDQVKELQTILRDKNTTRSDFKFYADRLTRYRRKSKSITIFKMRCNYANWSKVQRIKVPKGKLWSFYSKKRRSYGTGTGNTVIKAIAVLKEHNVQEENIILSNLFCTPIAAKTLVTAFPKMKILTSEIHYVAPNNFGQKYFGTEYHGVEVTSNVQKTNFARRYSYDSD
ncbi:uracil phosphoribosyltransferase homolog isoform X6 [Cephus cinctus]|uniref:Uracil phosphoribosyltransferase homolog isoform X6 n=1 Tax=Cephus cinctus TaxID=211228 RepID=A0AAJ7FSJ1_CEPCN|nr:uracil phosphoribosyltransferase homolog isoform X6 [Cephus cinctus]